MVPDFAQRWLDRILEGFPSEGETRERARVLIVILFFVSFAAAIPFFFLAFFRYLDSGTYLPVLVNVVLFLLGPALTLLTIRRKTPNPAVHLLCGGGVAGILLSLMPEGSSSILPAWYAIVVVLATMTGGIRTSLLWSAICLGALLGVPAVELFVLAVDPNIPVLMNLTFLMMFTTASMVWWETSRLAEKRRAFESAEALRMAQQRAMTVERLSTVGTLATGMAHELNTPLTYVLLNLEALADTIEDAEQRMILFEAAEGAVRMKEIVRQIKAFASADARRPEVGPTPIRPVMDAARTMLATQLRQVDRVLVDIPEDLMANANSGQLCQVFVNLLQNAAAVVPKEDGVIQIRARPDGDSVIIAVSDNGPGVPEELRERILEPFFTTKAPGDGTGLGLSISQNILHSLSGDLTLAVPSEGRGAEFQVVLPRSESLTPGLTREITAEANARRPLRILVVDDDPFLGRAIRRKLGEMHAVTVALSGGEACTLIEIDPSYDAIVCDVMMPGMTGWEFLEVVEEVYPELAPFMLFVSGGACTAEAEEFVKREACRFLPKPFTMDELETRILEIARPQGMETFASVIADL